MATPRASSTPNAVPQRRRSRGCATSTLHLPLFAPRRANDPLRSPLGHRAGIQRRSTGSVDAAAPAAGMTRPTSSRLTGLPSGQWPSVRLDAPDVEARAPDVVADVGGRRQRHRPLDSHLSGKASHRRAPAVHARVVAPTGRGHRQRLPRPAGRVPCSVSYIMTVALPRRVGVGWRLSAQGRIRRCRPRTRRGSPRRTPSSASMRRSSTEPMSARSLLPTRPCPMIGAAVRAQCEQSNAPDAVLPTDHGAGRSDAPDHRGTSSNRQPQ